MFTALILSSSVRSLDVVSIAAPLGCSSWRALGTVALYKHITLYRGTVHTLIPSLA